MTANKTLLAHLFLAFFLFGSKDFFSIYLTKGSYTPFTTDTRVSAQTHDESHLYLPTIQKFAEQKKITFETDIYELRNEKNSYPLLHTLVLGEISRLLKSVDLTWILFHALCPALIWLCLFFVAFHVTKNSTQAASIAWICALFSFGPRNSLLLGMDSLVQPLELTRLSQPGFSFLVLAISLILLEKALRAPKISWIVIAGIFCGLNFYSYYYYWIGLYLSLPLICLFFWTQGKTSWAKTTCFVSLVGLAVGFFHFYTLIQTSLSHSQVHLLAKVGAYHRTPSFLGLLALSSLLSSLFFKRIRTELSHNSFFAILFFLLVASSIGVNFHLLTGYDAQHDHFWNRLFQPVACLFFLSLLSKVKPFKLVSLNFACLLVALAVVRQAASAELTYAYHSKSSEEYKLLSWMKNHLSVDSVVGSTSPRLNLMIPSLTGRWPFVPVADRSLASPSESLRRYVTVAKLENKNLSETLRDFSVPTSEISHFWLLPIYVYFQRTQLDTGLKEELKEVWNQIDISKELSERKLTHLVTKKEFSLHGKTPLYENSDWKIYSIARD